MIIRPYTADDWERVCRVHDLARRDELAAAGLDSAFLPLEQTADSEGFHDYTIWVAELDRIVIGFVAFTSDELAWLYVDPTFYRRGVGTALIQKALAETKASLYAEVLDGNEAAIQVYHNAGFEVVGHDSGRMPGNEQYEVSVTVLRDTSAA